MGKRQYFRDCMAGQMSNLTKIDFAWSELIAQLLRLLYFSTGSIVQERAGVLPKIADRKKK